MKIRISLAKARFHKAVADVHDAPTFWGKLTATERGAIDIGGILVMGIGMVFLAVGFIMYPIIMTATDALLAYECTACTTVDAAYFTLSLIHI